ncbi:uncharacterized protein LOC132265796 [Phlebotomus argentipes]|uniref:uncharacterized protein LOC132265796 n=1 Tax=Phlebotomus argentipes TaxID=94469 RepID=UPI0028935E08|nr:uncharacterized protein LOC132265796 [Phlebotomus argentipes]
MEYEKSRNSTATRSRQGRTTSAQYDRYIRFLAKHPAVLNSSHKDYNRLWKDLTAELNTQGPAFSRRYWQGRLRNWQYQLIGKQRRNATLSPRDIRALQLIGKIKPLIKPDVETREVSESEESQGFGNGDSYLIPIESYRQKASRTSKDQHYAFVEFLEKHPHILDASQDVRMSSGYRTMWKELAGILNEKGPYRSTGQWQTLLRGWRNGIVAKNKRAKQQGVCNLTELEKKLLKIISQIPHHVTYAENSSDDDSLTAKLDMDENELMEETQSHSEEILADTLPENPDISSVWFTEPKKEIILDVVDEDDMLKESFEVSKNRMMTFPKDPVKKWTEKEVKCLINYIKGSLKDFEKPNPNIYYGRFLSIYPSISSDVDKKWNIVKEQVSFLQRQYNQVKKTLQWNTEKDPSSKLIQKTAQLLTKCPYYDDLDLIFSRMTQNAETQKIEWNCRPQKVFLPSQITVRNMKTSQDLFMPSTSSTSFVSEPSKEWEEEKLNLEIRRFELEKQKFIHEMQMKHKKFALESDMRKRELELRKLELENDRLEVEKMIEIEKLRLQQEERIERFQIQMQYGM